MSKPQKFKTLRGFRDFPPEELQLRSRLFEAFRRAAVAFGYQEYDGPPLETLDLYVEKSGEEIVEQLYAFTDKGGREVALRPEMTPSLARILADRSRSMPKPIRWFSIPQLFRYERTQRGRLREHYQWNVDLVGEDSIDADAEVLGVALTALRALGLGPDRIRARVSDRRLLAALLRSAGVPESALLTAYAIVDKVEREPRERTIERLVDEVGLTPEAAGQVRSLFDEPGLDPVRASFGDDPAVVEGLEAMEAFLGVIEELGFGPYVEFDLTIVRGLAYYTGPVFEIFDRGGELRALCGGGRYDNLLERVGGESLPAVGFGMGDVVLSELLAEEGLNPEYDRGVDFFLISIDDADRGLARRVAAHLRTQGQSVILPLRGMSVGKQFKAAASEGARQAVILGPDEIERGEAVMRTMADGNETSVSLRRLLGGE
ncbi:MAG: histidine--tRNA ligase [Gemmatimonadales bacterium]|nr:MAG: histidine--tRNA ligase [Gemmatimonadales bacterium]